MPQGGKDWVAWPRASVPLGYSNVWKECGRRFDSTNHSGPKSSYVDEFAVAGWTQTGNRKKPTDDWEAEM